MDHRNQVEHAAVAVEHQPWRKGSPQPPPACWELEAAVLGQVPPCAAVRWFRASGPRSSTPLSRAWSRAQRASRPPPEDRRAVARWVARQHASARRGAADLQPAGAARKAGRSRRCPARPTPPPVVCPGGSGRARTLAIESIALSSPPPSPLLQIVFGCSQRGEGALRRRPSAGTAVPADPGQRPTRLLAQSVRLLTSWRLPPSEAVRT